ncbi:ErpL protein (plasmid) [Borreliella yangtzensis]|uniref:RNase H-like nuclease (RuvC/YqgF family) n=1 Tax=Borreliella yangtzensis TaxID=683292 RepID=A0ABR6PBJ0_9SPIR|nr:putative RNase H-like nuclease (RuvC/YqgF family) [Borreliella yangtzensis]
MKKKIDLFIICSIFALVISCKNYAISKDLENSEQVVKGSKQVEKEVENKFDKLLDTLDILDIKDANDTKEIEEQIKKLKETIEELKKAIEETDPKKTPLKKYSEYEEKVKKIKEELEKKLKDKVKDKKEIEDKLKELEDSLKKKKNERKKALEEAKKKFQEYKKQVESATGVTQGHQVQRQGGVGLQAFNCAKEYGLTVSFSNDTDTSNMSSGVIESALKKIEEEEKELKNLEENK